REYPEIKLKVVSAKLDNYAEIPVRDLSTGLVDAYIGNLFMTTYMIQSRGYTNVKVAAPTPFENHNQAMALRNDWPELAGIINKTLAAMTPDEHAAIRNRWLSVRYEYGISTADVLKWIAGVAGVSLIFIAFVMFWNRRLKAEVAFRKKIEADLRDSENLLNDVGAIAKIGGWEMDLVTQKSKWTRGTHDIFEIGMGEPIPGPDEYIQYCLPEYREQVNAAMTALIHEDQPLWYEAQLQTAKGNIKWCRAMGRAIRHDGKCMKLYGTFQDITERKESETEARRRESLFEKIFNLLPVGLWIADENGRLLRGNPAGIQIWGAEPDVSPSEYGVFKARRLPSGEEIAPDDWALAHTVKTGMTVVDEMLEIDAFDGTKKIILNYTAPVLDDAGNIRAAIVVNHDITLRKRAEAAERQTAVRHRTLIDTIPDLIWLKDLNGVYLSCNPTFERFFGARESEIIGKTDYDFVNKDLADFFREHDRKSISAGHPCINEERLTFADGGYQGLFETIKTPMRDADGNLVGVLGIARDITGRKTAEEALKENEQRYKQAENLGHVGNWEYDLVTEKFWGSDEAKRIYGFDPDSRKFTVDEVENCIPERERVHQALVDLMEKNEPYNLEFEIRPVSGPKTRIIRSIAEIMKDDSGAPIKVVGVIQDITDRKTAEKEKLELEAQLRQSQKMEAIGRLAGGVAHDFNNMLSIILGNSEIIMDDLGQTNPFLSNLQEIHKAAERSTNLTRQLLAFARRQTIEPKILNLNQVVADMLKMLQRLIGEDITLTWLPATELWTVKIDPSQVDQIMANLCVNARDAIRGVGKVTIETGNTVFNADYCRDHAGFIPGDFVMIAVSDNGSGMDQETLANLFEPFYTTKDIGQGSGLGLATVYGIVKQNNGFINVYTEPGDGSTFKIYLPVHAQPVVTQQKEDLQKTTPKGNETILVVEDETAILKMTRMMLERLGYTVLAASTPNEAIRIVEESGLNAIHLLMTDVVMPEMNGRDLSKRLLGLSPNMKCLFMSGYTANVIAHHGVLDAGVHFINKPFSRQDLSIKIREVLDQVVFAGENF
ncbi:MAG: PAS domain S-box protein, partial [Desulfatirhabdiaceae bacterium]